MLGSRSRSIWSPDNDALALQAHGGSVARLAAAAGAGDSQPEAAPQAPGGEDPQYTGPGDNIADNTSSSTTIAVGGTLNSSINTTGDVDYIRVSLVAGQSYTFSVDGGTMDDSYVELRNTSNVIVDEDDDGGLVRDSFLVYTATSTGDYWIVVRGYDNSVQNQGTYTLHVDTVQTGNSSPTAFVSNGKPMFSWDESAIQITREGDTWATAFNTPTVVTYAYRSSAPAAMPSDTSGFSSFSAAQIVAAEASLAAWAAVANIVFQRVDQGDGYSNNAAILFGNYTSGQSGAAAFANMPASANTSSTSVEGDVWVNVSIGYNATPVRGDYGYQVLLHEIGHAIGMEHPGEYNGGSPSYEANAEYFFDSRAFTVMSYFPSSPVGANLPAFASLPQLHDIAAAQRLYGANTTTRTGDTIYGFNSNTNIPEYTLTSGIQAAVFAIWDGGGIDTIDMSGYAVSMTIDLREEAMSSVGGSTFNVSIARGTVIENAIGGPLQDTIIGNDVANVLTGNGAQDVLQGNGGNDTLDGGASVDQLFGGEGNDTIYWDAGDDLPNVLGGNGADLLIFTSGAAPTSFSLTSHSFESAEGRFTDTGGNPWATRIEYYDNLWRADRTIVNNDNGSRETTIYDRLSNQTWSENFIREDLLLRQDFTVLTYDNGSRDTTDFDEANAFSWASNYIHQDTLLREDFSVLTYDNGARDTTDRDETNSVSWVTNFIRQDTLLREDFSVLTYDNGARDTTDRDETNSVAWVTNFIHQDTLLREDFSVVTFDNGARETTDRDETNSVAWVTNFIRQDSLGREDFNVVTFDDGASETTDRDETNSFDWATNFIRQDALGRDDFTVLTYDDGRYAVQDFDQADAFSWANMWWLYDENGVLLSFVGTNDDGGHF